MKIVLIRSYFGPHFPAFELNEERYEISLRIQSEYGKIWTRIAPNTNFLRSMMDALSIATRTNISWSALRQFITLICFKIGLDLDGIILALSFRIFCQPWLKWQTSKELKIRQKSFYQLTTFL